MRAASIILLMGVAGSGKSTVGQLLARELGWGYHEADDFHPPANKEKMGRGVPLDDTDRAPWLAAIRATMEASAAAGQSAVFTCSALKESYRRQLIGGLPGVRLVFLSGERALLQARLEARPGHYMKAGMLDSQLAILEPPRDALKLDVRESPTELVATIRREFRL
jgi:gluconokinase